MTKRPKMTPAEQLKEKLYKINITDNISKAKTHFNFNEFVKRAKEVRKTFKNGDILPSEITY